MELKEEAVGQEDKNSYAARVSTLVKIWSGPDTLNFDP